MNLLNNFLTLATATAETTPAPTTDEINLIWFVLGGLFLIVIFAVVVVVSSTSSIAAAVAVDDDDTADM